MFVPVHDAVAGRFFEAEIVAEQAGAAVFGPLELGGLLLGDFVGDGVVGPDLAVRMGVAGAHHGAAVFEDLDVVDERPGGEIVKLLDPGVNDRAQVVHRHVGDGEAVPGREADHAANTRLGFGDQEAALLVAIERGIGLERGEIVIEDERRGVSGIAHAAGARVPGTEVALRVVVRLPRRSGLLDLALPGPLGSMRRDQHPFTGERVEAAVGVLLPVEHPYHGNRARRVRGRSRRRFRCEGRLGGGGGRHRRKGRG